MLSRAPRSPLLPEKLALNQKLLPQKLNALRLWLFKLKLALRLSARLHSGICREGPLGHASPQADNMSVFDASLNNVTLHVELHTVLRLHYYSCEVKFVLEHAVARLREVARFDFLLPRNYVLANER